MFKKLGKWLFWSVLLLATGSAALSIGRKAARLIEKENSLLAAAGGEAVDALRSMGETGQTFLARAGKEQMTILFTMLNDHWSEPEAILLLELDLTSERARLTRFDPDTAVERSNGERASLGGVYASAYAEARRQGDSSQQSVRKGNIALKGLLRSHTGTAVDHYLSLNSEGLRKLIDSVGGVTVHLKKAIELDDSARSLHIHLSEGEQTLNGSQAVDLIRARRVSDETDPQKLILSAFFRKLRQDFSFSTALSLLKASLSSTVSDLSLPDLVPLIRALLSISSSQIELNQSFLSVSDHMTNSTCQTFPFMLQ